MSGKLDLAEWFSSRVDYGDKFKSWYVISSDSKNGELTKFGKKRAEAAKKKNIYEKLGQPISFFFFGDLVDILLDGIHSYPMRKIKNETNFRPVKLYCWTC